MLNTGEGAQAHGDSRIPQFTRGDRFRKAREKTGMEQGPFAEHIGVSRGTVSNYERDMSPAKKVVASAWAMATNVPVEWLMDGIDEESGDPFLDLLRRSSDGNGPTPELRAQLRRSLLAIMAEEDETETGVNSSTPE